MFTKVSFYNLGQEASRSQDRLGSLIKVLLLAVVQVQHPGASDPEIGRFWIGFEL